MKSAQHNKEVIRKLYEQSLNQRNMSLLRDLIADDFVGARGVKGAAGFEEPVAALIHAFPDIQWKIEELIAEENKVLVRWTWTGTHLGPFQHFAASGKTISNEGMGIFELNDGEVTKLMVYTDRLGFLQSLDAVPIDLTLLANHKSHPDKVIFIDKFAVPIAATKEFNERMRVNRRFVETLPGFIEHAAYTHSNPDGNLICVTTAAWENEQVLEKAKEAVQAEYKRSGFNIVEFLQRLGIKMERGIYEEVKD